MVQKAKERLRAIELRKDGFSIKSISKELKVSVSSVSIWVRGIPCVLRITEAVRRKQVSKKASETRNIQLLESEFDALSSASKKKRVVLEQNGKCLICGISEWQSKPILITVDHIDGDNQNDARTNLRGLCPNCHSQTETYCGRNQLRRPNTKGCFRVSDEELLTVLFSSRTMSEALRKVHLSKQRHNYDRCRSLLEKLSGSQMLEAA